ncbi:MAG: SDR family NAD(P)-dependent oxidoreductase [Roseovarius sp.]|nr:SDR family NAD(P)-dependent oxidoreductase [Roseovarius sp.]MCY4207112.1 SDR family NAD(P)-dependent oxidoreductase [Roseovarius sp.]MCY4292388.1 SDR family NAD(P)-dependent oxidoreductase [Roseovarius sp.]MCY4316925.1 SDR family NAD(P)-dependent oxidoreductase [Roseovarius sp.]
MSFSISGKTAIVTGGAGAVGLAIGRYLEDKGANVMFADNDESALVREFGDNLEGGNIRYFAGDLREKLCVSNLLSATIGAFDNIDILINASLNIMQSNALDPDDASIEALLQNNLLSTLRISRQVARRMIEQAHENPDGEAGTIINLSSIAARRTHPDLLGFSISIVAIDQMTRSLAVALAPHRIRVNALAYGSVMSSSMRKALKDNNECRNGIIGNTPLGRIASASELAEAVHYLTCDGSGFMTGQIMTVDGGRTLVDPVASPIH